MGGQGGAKEHMKCWCERELVRMENNVMGRQKRTQPWGTSTSVSRRLGIYVFCLRPKWAGVLLNQRRRFLQRLQCQCGGNRRQCPIVWNWYLFIRVLIIQRAAYQFSEKIEADMFSFEHHYPFAKLRC